MLNIAEDNPLSEYKRLPVTFPHNQVLYGVSGTGKSYLAPYYALAIAEGLSLSDVQKEPQKHIMQRFREYQAQGQIAWLTLHENYTYTHLIQAYTPQAGKADGLWKQMADRAQAHYDFVMRPQAIPRFQDLLNLYIAHHINPDTEEAEFTLTVPKRTYNAIVVRKITTEALAYQRKNKKNVCLEGTFELKIQDLEAYYKEPNADAISADAEAIISALWAYTKAKPDRGSKLQNFVLILDEMQSVNFPTLLGEGLSLLESDRRTGATHALAINLPSGDVLRFPPNLFLVGTWNTSDCPLPTQGGLLRRFAWVECVVRYDLISDSALRSFCEALNEALERELQTPNAPIGHTYFLGQTEADLPTILQQHILPLLKELLPAQSSKITHLVQMAKARSQK